MQIPTPRQLPLPFTRSSNDLERLLADRLGRPVLLRLTDNSTTMLSARPAGGVLEVRLHRMFLAADDAVLDDVVACLRGSRRALPRFREFVRQNREVLLKRPARQVSVRPRGRFHDLAELSEEINREYFGGSVAAAITWGTKSPRGAVRKRTLGSYSERTNTIRVNPVLDRRTVPRFYVAFIVYHEMLHAALGTPVRNGRRSVHSREFRRREKLFREYERATAWERGRTS